MSYIHYYPSNKTFHVYFLKGMFCAIPGIGVGFVKAIGFYSEDNADNSGASQDPLIFDEPKEFADATMTIRIICFSVAVFMICSSLVSFAAKENPSNTAKKSRVPSWIRYGLQLITGGLIACFPLIGNGNVFITILFIPFLMLSVGIFQLWGMKSDTSLLVTPLLADNFRMYQSTG